MTLDILTPELTAQPSPVLGSAMACCLLTLHSMQHALEAEQAAACAQWAKQLFEQLQPACDDLHCCITDLNDHLDRQAADFSCMIATSQAHACKIGDRLAQYENVMSELSNIISGSSSSSVTTMSVTQTNIEAPQVMTHEPLAPPEIEDDLYEVEELMYPPPDPNIDQALINLELPRQPGESQQAYEIRLRSAQCIRDGFAFANELHLQNRPPLPLPVPQNPPVVAAPPDPDPNPSDDGNDGDADGAP